MSAPARPIKPPKGRAIIAFLFLDESAGWLVLVGTILVVAGIVIISWKPGVAAPGHRWWHVFYSLGAGLLARFRFSAPPLRTITNEPVFFCRLDRGSFIGLFDSLFLYHPKKKRAVLARTPRELCISPPAVFEVMGALLSLLALGSGRVVIVAPIVATRPLWNLLIAAVFLRGNQDLTFRTVGGHRGCSHRRRRHRAWTMKILDSSRRQE